MLAWIAGSSPWRRAVSSTSPMVSSSAAIGSRASPRQRQMEEHLGVGRALQVGEERGVDRQHEVAPHARGSRRPPRCGPRASARGGTGGSSSPGWRFRRSRGRGRGRAATRRERRGVAGSRRPTPARRCGRRPGASPVPYQPTPNPSPFVVSAPRRECRLWSIRPCLGRNSSSSISTGCPCQAIHRHMASSFSSRERWDERAGPVAVTRHPFGMIQAARARAIRGTSWRRLRARGRRRARR